MSEMWQQDSSLSSLTEYDYFTDKSSAPISDSMLLIDLGLDVPPDLTFSPADFGLSCPENDSDSRINQLLSSPEATSFSSPASSNSSYSGYPVQSSISQSISNAPSSSTTASSNINLSSNHLPNSGSNLVSTQPLGSSSSGHIPGMINVDGVLDDSSYQAPSFSLTPSPPATQLSGRPQLGRRTPTNASGSSSSEGRIRRGRPNRLSIAVPPYPSPRPPVSPGFTRQMGNLTVNGPPSAPIHPPDYAYMQQLPTETYPNITTTDSPVLSEIDQFSYSSPQAYYPPQMSPQPNTYLGNVSYGCLPSPSPLAHSHSQTGSHDRRYSSSNHESPYLQSHNNPSYSAPGLPSYSGN